VSRYQKKHSPTHHPDHPIFISLFHLPRSTASSLFKLRVWQSFCTTFHVLFGLPLGLEPYTSYSIHFYTQSLSSFCITCPYHHNLFCCSFNIMSSIPSLSPNSSVVTVAGICNSVGGGALFDIPPRCRWWWPVQYAPCIAGQSSIPFPSPHASSQRTCQPPLPLFYDAT